MQLSAHKQKIRETFDALAPERRMWREKNAAYYAAQAALGWTWTSPRA